jgi:hypothetical protein
MTSTIKRRPRGYRIGISREVFEFVMKLLRDTLGTTGRYLELMRSNTPLRIQGPVSRGPPFGTSQCPGARIYQPRQFYRPHNEFTYEQGGNNIVVQGDWLYSGKQTMGPSGRASNQWSFRWLEYFSWVNVQPFRHSLYGSILPFRHTYNASRII